MDGIIKTLISGFALILILLVITFQRVTVNCLSSVKCQTLLIMTTVAFYLHPNSSQQCFTFLDIGIFIMRDSQKICPN